jgi:membrane protease subunit (stomatin/prohibitin family)
MTAYQIAQEYSNLRWGTMLPVAVMLGGKVVEVRARGSFSVTVGDPDRLAQEISDPQALAGCLRPYMTNIASLWIGERAGQVASPAELSAITPQLVQGFRSEVEDMLTGMGLRLTDLSIEAIEPA